MTLLAPTLQEATRAEVHRWLPALDEWLLPGAMYGVQHTWPQLYRSDGGGRFFVATDGDRLLSHCAVRTVHWRDGDDALPVALLGSVATDPTRRGQGLASAVLDAALAALGDSVRATLLWAEQGGLYQRAGFVPGEAEQLLGLVRRPHRADGPNIRLVEFGDHAALHALHAAKPQRVERSLAAMSGLLTTPGLTTVVLERDGAVTAYACTGKGADLAGHWHELGGSDADLAELLPAAMHLLGTIESVLLLPPYRSRLRELLGRSVSGEATVPGPMVRATPPLARSPWIDGLDSV